MTEQSHVPSLDQVKEANSRLTRRRGRSRATASAAAPAAVATERKVDTDQQQAAEATAGERRSTSRRQPARPSRAQSTVDDAKQQITLFLPNDVIAAVNAYCDRGQDGRPLTHGAAVINALIAVDDRLADLVAEGPTPVQGGWAVEQPVRRESGQSSMWTCSLMVRNRRQLDERAEALGVPRSRVVAAALREFLSVPNDAGDASGQDN